MQKENTYFYDYFVIEKISADINNDNINEDLYLVGKKEELTDIVISNIKVIIKDNNNYYEIIPLINKGYNPHLFIGNFNNDLTNDILISIESGNTGLEIYYYIYSFIDNDKKVLFDFDLFNNKYKYDVIYKDNYIVDIISKFNDKKFSINVSNKNREYLNQIYNPNKSLKRPLRGMISDIINIHPVVSEAFNGYDLYVSQRVIGYYNADTLGMIITPLRWHENDFEIISNNQYLTLFGSEDKK